tara:strand:- start:429 stop:650 length:222 start_codon:yes stop_codon:yes gene_type:complete
VVLVRIAAHGLMVFANRRKLCLEGARGQIEHKGTERYKEKQEKLKSYVSSLVQNRCSQFTGKINGTVLIRKKQ